MSRFLQQLGADLDRAAERRVDRRRRIRLVRAGVAAGVVVAAAALWILLPGSWPTDQDRPAAGERESTNQQQAPPPAATTTTTRASCDVGARPGYFVPGEGPLALVGCAQLPVSGQRVEFSANLSRLDGAEQLCINPAYGDGKFIPAICNLDPPVSEFAVRDATQPRHAVNGYGYVIWGTAGTARSVDATFDGGKAEAVLLPVPEEVARDYGATPFALFVAELPLSAACGSVSVQADGATERIEPKPQVCEASSKTPGA
jgi:hypothetical protein